MPVRVLDRWGIDGPMDGPIVIEEPDTTVVVRPGWQVHRNELGSIVLRRQP
jgi:N-methylhydantoinase A/oxoprolinase/acetone carboxylase beta subunit